MLYALAQTTQQAANPNLELIACVVVAIVFLVFVGWAISKSL